MGESSLVNKFSKKKLKFMGEWNSPTIEVSLWLRWDNTKEAQSFGFDNVSKEPLQYIDGNYFYEENKLCDEIERKCYNELKKGKSTIIDYFINISKKITIEIEKLMIEYEGNYNDIMFIKKSFELQRRIRFPWFALLIIDFSVERYLQEISQKNGDKIEDVIKLAPDYETFVHKDNFKIYEFKNKLEELNLSKKDFSKDLLYKKNFRLGQEIATYQKETEFVGTHHFWGEPRTYDKFITEIFDIEKRESKKVEKRRD